MRWARGSDPRAVIAKEYEWIVQTAGRRTPVAMYLGTNDRSLTLEDGARTFELQERSGFTVHYLPLAGQGHDYWSAAPWVNADVWAFFEEHPLGP